MAANLEVDHAWEEKKSKRAAVLASLNSILDVNTLPDLKVKQIDLQLAWHRQADSQVPICKLLPRRLEKLKALTEAVERHNLREVSAGGVAGVNLQLSGPEELRDDDVDLADDDWDMEKE